MMKMIGLLEATDTTGGEGGGQYDFFLLVVLFYDCLSVCIVGLTDH